MEGGGSTIIHSTRVWSCGHSTEGYKLGRARIKAGKYLDHQQRRGTKNKRIKKEYQKEFDILFQQFSSLEKLEFCCASLHSFLDCVLLLL